MAGAFVIQRENRAFAILCHSATSGSDCHSMPLFFRIMFSVVNNKQERHCESR